MIKIMEASAGAGKTYNLAKTYIRILLQSDDLTKYRHILAVTFTNKATDEMKRRILQELYTVAEDPRKSPYYGDFVREGVIVSVPDTQKKAQDILGRILHDYGAFAVSTIDRFFQQTLKAFSREIGHFASYQVELDKDSLVDESVARMLDNLSASDKGLLDWLKKAAMESLEQEGRFKLEDKVGEMARSLKSDRLCQLLAVSGKTVAEMYSRENLEKIRTVCRSVVDAFPETVWKGAQAVMDVLREKGLSPNEFKNHFLTALEKYLTLKKGDAVSSPTPAFVSRARNVSEWFSKANAWRLPAVQSSLEAPLEAFCALFEGQPYIVYRTAQLLLAQINDLGISRELDEQFSALLKDKNVLSLDDSNTLLREIIGGSDAPFIYEKLGVRFEDFLLDEFQDTSLVQWDNFRPLLHNSDAEGFENLVVGDVKQSIYRFRDSDWRLLAERLPAEFRDYVPDPLKGNYRSLERIVKFNNEFFDYAAGQLGLTKLYSGVTQEVCVRDPAPGSVDLVFKESREEEMDEIVATIRDLVGRGASYCDMAVLVRMNKDGAEVASRLIAEGIPVVSDDSLRVKSSRIVRLVVSGLSLADVPPYRDKNGKLTVRSEAFAAWEAGIETPSAYDSLPSLCEQILRSVIAFAGSTEGEVPYIQSFMDYLQNWATLNGNDLPLFLKEWAESDPMISSPASGDSVRIITIHKSKGLEFPYVILPFVESIPYSRPDKQAGPRNWLRPQVEGTALEGSVDGFFRVPYNSRLEHTLFQDDYRAEIDLQKVDNLNLLYVAMTRPLYGIKVIANATGRGDNMAKLLAAYKGGDYSCGTLYDFAHLARKTPGETIDLAYPSWPLGDVTSGDSRLKVSTDAADFFSQEGTVGMKASQRLRGIVYHDILSRVRVPSDLGDAVRAAVGKGEIEAADAPSVEEFLREKIESVRPLGWFPSDPEHILNEVEILDADGTLHRPDRVVADGETAIVVDYKFGEEKKSYLAQVSRYMRLLQALGYPHVTGFVWYVEQGSDGVRAVGTGRP